MTLSTTSNSVSYTGNGVTTEWDFSFLVLDATDLVVKTFNSVTLATTTLTAGQYSVVGIGNAAGGTVTYPLSGSPIASTIKIIIERVVPYTQTLDVNNQAGFNPTVVENTFDRIVMMIQQIGNNQDLALSLPVGDTFASLVLPFPADRAEKYVYFASDGSLSLTGTAPAVQYQGAFTTAQEPTLRLGGGALQDGDLYYNTTVSRLKVRDTGSWVNGVDSSSAIDIVGMTALGGALASGDFIPIYDLSNTANRKMTPQELFNYVTTLTAETAIALADELPIYDATGSATDKMTVANFVKFLNLLTAETTVNSAADTVMIWDDSASDVRKMTVANLTAGTPVFTQSAVTGVTSGTSVNIGSLPTGIKAFDISFYRVSTNGTSGLILQLGDATGGVQTTGYRTGASDDANQQHATSGFALTVGTAAGDTMTGMLSFRLHDPTNHIWVCQGVTIQTGSGNAVKFVTGDVTLTTGPLDRVRLTTLGGVNTFDNASATMSLEYRVG